MGLANKRWRYIVLTVWSLNANKRTTINVKGMGAYRPNLHLHHPSGLYTILCPTLGLFLIWCTDDEHMHAQITYLYIHKQTYIHKIYTYVHFFFIWDMRRRGETNINRNLIDRFVLPDAGVKLTIFETLTAPWAIGWPALKCNASLGTGQKSCVHGTYHAYIDKPVNRHYLTGSKPVNLNWALI